MPGLIMNPAPIRSKWAGAMTDRERLNRKMNHQSVDRCFNMEFGYWDENFSRWAMFRDHAFRNNHKADRLLNFALLGNVGGPVVHAHAVHRRGY